MPARSVMDTAGVPGWKARLDRIEPLEPEEERELIARAQGGDEGARRRVVESQLRTVLRYCLKFRRYGVPLAELVSEGTIGLMVALDKFDLSRGLRFSTYAAPWVRNFVTQRVLRDQSKLGGLRGPFRTKHWFALRRELAKSFGLGLEPDALAERVAERLSLRPKDVRRMLAELDASMVPLTTTGLVAGQGTGCLLPSDAPTPEDIYDERENDVRLRDAVREALARLPARDRAIVERRLMDEDPPTLAEVGREHGVSRERARQLEVRSKRRLAEWIAAAMGSRAA